MTVHLHLVSVNTEAYERLKRGEDKFLLVRRGGFELYDLVLVFDTGNIGNYKTYRIIGISNVDNGELLTFGGVPCFLPSQEYRKRFYIDIDSHRNATEYIFKMFATILYGDEEE